MSRSIARSLLCGAIIAMAQPSAFGQCSLNCLPGMKPGYSVNAQYTIYLDTSTLSATGLAAAQVAIDQWNQAYTGLSERPVFTYSSNPFSANIVVRDDPSLHGTTTGGQYGGGIIDINPDYDGDSDFLKQVMLHEMGHAIGFTDVSASGCDAETIMWFSIDPNGNHMTSIGSADTCKLGAEFDRINRERLRPPCGYSCQEGSGADSPIVINFENGGYRLTGNDAPVLFDIAATGHPTWIGWTAAAAREAFLALDRDNDGTISSGAELFGNATMLKNGQRAPNGFAALAELDDNNDGLIDHKDAIWPALVLWTDLNHDGVSQLTELRPVNGSSVRAIGLDYHWSGRRDVSGNTFRYQSQVWMTNGHGAHGNPAGVRHLFCFFTVDLERGGVSPRTLPSP